MSWKIVSLGEVCKVIAGQSPKGTSINKEGKGLPFYQGKKDFGDVYINAPTAWTTKITKEAIKDDILISVRAPVGPVNIATGHICIGRGLAAIRTSDKINKSYLFNYLLKIQKDLVGNAGAVFNSINKKQIESLKIPLPPLSVQQMIVAKLVKIFTETDKAIAATEANAKNAKVLFLSYLVEVFNRSGDGWIRETIGNVCSLRSGTTVIPSLEKTNGELPYLKVADMNLIFNQGSISSSSRFVNISDVNKNSIIRKGSTIFPKRGGAIDTNKKRITNVDIVADLNIMSVLPNDTLNSHLLYFYFLGLDMRKLGSGSSIRQINNYDIEPLTINFPKSHTEQQGLVSLISKLQVYSEKLISNYKKKKLEMVMLKQSILQQAFNGELVKAV